jgi:AraC-like DNA-binding protein
VKNSVFDAQQHYSKIKSAIEPLLFDKATLNEWVTIAEKILLDKININRMNHNLESVLFCIFRNKGNIKTTTLAAEVFISSRQLERIFNEYIGVSPWFVIKISGMIFYLINILMWQMRFIFMVIQTNHIYYMILRNIIRLYLVKRNGMHLARQINDVVNLQYN